MADSIKKMANTAASKLGGSEKAKNMVESVGEKIDEKTGKKYSDKIDKGQQAIQEQMEKREQRG